MKRAISATACLILCWNPAESNAADADPGIYLRLDSGYSFSRDGSKNLNDDVGQSAIISGGMGYRFTPMLRADVTLGYRGGYEVDKSYTIGGLPAQANGDVTALTTMANLYVDVYRWGMFTPYVGAGIGYTHNKLDDQSLVVGGTTGQFEGASKNHFAWQLSAGVAAEMEPGWLIDAGYRYLDMGEFETGNSVNLGGAIVTGRPAKANLRAHEFQIGLRYRF